MVPRVRERMDSREFIVERKVLKRPEREKVWFGQEYSIALTQSTNILVFEFT